MNGIRGIITNRQKLLLVVAMVVVSLGGSLLPVNVQAAESSNRVFLPAIQSGFEETILLETDDASPVSGESDPTDPAGSVGDPATLWSASFETQSYPGHIEISGKAAAALTNKQVSSGRYAAALSIANANGSQRPEPGVRLAYNARGVVKPSDPKNLPDVAYYSASFYFPHIVLAEWWNIMQWKQAVIVNGSQTRLPIYSIHPLYHDGGMSFFLRSRVDTKGKYQDNSVYIAGSPKMIPLKKWVRLECMYKWSKLPDGRITCWMDGQLLWDVNNIITEFDIPYYQYPRQWTINNYAGQTWPESHVLYVDNLAVRTKPLGAQ